MLRKLSVVYYFYFSVSLLPYPEVDEAPKEVAEDKPTPQPKTLVPEGMPSLAQILEWDLVAFLAIFIAMCYVVLFL